MYSGHYQIQKSLILVDAHFHQHYNINDNMYVWCHNAWAINNMLRENLNNIISLYYYSCLSRLPVSTAVCMLRCMKAARVLNLLLHRPHHHYWLMQQQLLKLIAYVIVACNRSEWLGSITGLDADMPSSKLQPTWLKFSSCGYPLNWRLVHSLWYLQRATSFILRVQFLEIARPWKFEILCHSNHLINFIRKLQLHINFTVYMTFS